MVTLTLSNVDLELFLKHYHVTNLTYLDGFMFKGAYGLYDEYIDKYVQLKIDSSAGGKTPNPTDRTISKLLLNNL